MNLALKSLKKIKLANLPTPLYEANNLSKTLDGPKIFIKREDLTGMAFGGNKTRMFEYVLAKVLADNHDCIIASGAVQSNYCRQIAAACAKLDLDLYLVLRNIRGLEYSKIQGNLLLDLLLDANVQILDNVNKKEQRQLIEKLAKKLKKQGRNPYIARGYNTKDLGYDSSAYLVCMLEIIKQAEKKDLEVNYIYVASADATHAGLLFAAEYLKTNIDVIAFNPDCNIKNSKEKVIKVCKRISEVLNLKAYIDPAKIISISDYAGNGYGLITKSCKEAIKLVARTEGVFLDPVYSGKAMAGLIDHIRKKNLNKDDTIIFIHTGGGPSLFAYAEDLDLKFSLFD